MSEAVFRLAFFWKMSPEDFEGMSIDRIEEYARMSRKLAREMKT